MPAAQNDIARCDHRRARRYFWVWLLLATWVSLSGNVTHAVITAPLDTRWLAAGVAAVPPVALLMSVHGLAVLAKAKASGAVYRWSVTATSALALGAFLLSFVALRDLAVIAGIRPRLAPVLPLVIDLAIAVATLALVAIGDKPARRSPAAGRSVDATAMPRSSTKRASRGSVGGLGATDTRDEHTPLQEDGAKVPKDRAHQEIAAELVDAKLTRQPVDVVASILAAHEGGAPLNRIAKDLKVHHSAVSRVINASGQRSLEAVPA